MAIMLVMTAKEQTAAARSALKRGIKGKDVRNHNGARSIVHHRHNEYKRFGGKEKRELMRGMD